MTPKHVDLPEGTFPQMSMSESIQRYNEGVKLQLGMEADAIPSWGGVDLGEEGGDRSVKEEKLPKGYSRDAQGDLMHDGVYRTYIKPKGSMGDTVSEEDDEGHGVEFPVVTQSQEWKEYSIKKFLMLEAKIDKLTELVEKLHEN